MLKKIIALCLLLTCSFTFSVHAVESQWGRISTDTWKEINGIDSRFKSPKSLLEEVDYYVENISSYLNLPNWYKDNNLRKTNKIKISATDEGTRVSRGYVLELKINKRIFNKGYAPLAHELTHIIANGTLLSYTEGLAYYMQEKFGRNISYINFGAPIHPLAKEFIEKSNKDFIEKVIKSQLDFNTIEEWRNYLILGQSFVKYLIEEYGIEKFMTFAKAVYVNQACEEVYNKSLDNVEEEWLKFLEGVEPFEYTYKEWVNKKVGKDFAKGFLYK